MVGEGKDASNEGRVGGPAGQVAESLFPVRFLGFGFYWAWLFLAGVTPSPLIGAPLCFAGAPFEMVELSVRALVLVVVLIASRQLASVAGQRGLLVLGVAASAAAAPLALGLGGGGRHRRSVHVPAVALLFRVHEGGRDLRSARGILCYRLGALPSNAALGFNAMAAASVLFPALSGTAFVLSQRLMKARTGEELFVEEPVSGDGARKAGEALPSAAAVAASRHGAAAARRVPCARKYA